MLKGILFDMDGVLVDSEELIYEAARQMFKEHGIIVNKSDFKPFIGTGEDSYIGNVAKKYGFDIDLKRDKQRTYEIYSSLASKNLVLLPGVLKFIKLCKERKLKLAIATSADEIKMQVNLKAAKLDHDVFDTTVNGLEVKYKKPHPEIYLRAAQKLNLNPVDCLVVEDAVNGIDAAKEAGCMCVALTTSFRKEDLFKADWIFRDLSEVTDEVFEW